MENEKSYLATLRRTDQDGKEQKVHVSAGGFVEAAQAVIEAAVEFCELIKLELLD